MEIIRRSFRIECKSPCRSYRSKRSFGPWERSRVY